MEEFIEGVWIGNDLRYTVEDVIKKPLEEKAEKIHSSILFSKELKDKYFIATKIVGNEKDGYTLHVLITKNEEYKHKENSHEQETDI